MKLFTKPTITPDSEINKKISPSLGNAIGAISDPGRYNLLHDPIADFSSVRLSTRAYRKMIKTDPIIGSLVLNFENVLKSKDFTLQKRDSSDRDYRFFTSIFSHYFSPRVDLLSQITSAIPYGFMVSEKIWGNFEGYITPIDFSPRHQTTIDEINYVTKTIRQSSCGTFEMPYGKCLHHCFRSEARDPYGISILRHIYKPYYYKCDIEASEAAGLERDLAGLPVMKAPQGFDFDAADPTSPKFDPATAYTLDWAMNTIASIRRDTQQGVVLPYGWELEIVKGENRTVIPTSDIIVRYNNEIAYGLLQNFMSFTASNLNAGVAEIQERVFTDAINAYLKSIAALLNSIITEIAAVNGIKKVPFFTTPEASKRDLTTIADYFHKLTTAQLIAPTKELSQFLLNYSNIAKEAQSA